MNTLDGKIALVTGAEGAIGAATARHLAAAGATVVVNYLENAMLAAEVVKSVEAQGGVAIALRANITKQGEIDAMYEEIAQKFGRLDILVNNAGFGHVGPLTNVTELQFDETFGVNVKGALFMAQGAIRLMTDGGRIVNVSSSSVMFPLSDMGLYTASKAALRTFTEVWAKELAKFGITVNSILPGPTMPGMMGQAPNEVRQRMAASSPFQRLGTPDDIAPVVAFLCSESARWISGEHILVNGAAAA